MEAHGQVWRPTPGQTTCFLCYREMNSGAGLYAHLRRHLDCDEVKRRRFFNDDGDFDQDLDLPRDQSSKSYACKSCEYQGPSVYALRRHRDLHTTPYLCRFCDHASDTIEDLREHWRRCENREDRPHICEFCNKSFHFKSSLRHHLFGHENSRNNDKLDEKKLKFRYRPLQCFVCDEQIFGFQYGHHVRTHIRFQGRYICRRCPLSFETLSALQEHVASSHRLFHCHQCTFSTRSRESLGAHIGRHHEKGEGGSLMKKMFPCTHPGCRKSFNHQDLYEKHLALHGAKRKSGDNDDTPGKIRVLRKWTPTEDEYLRAGVAEFGKGCWKEIIEKYKDRFHESRDRFSIRLRYGYLAKMGKV